MHQVARGVTRLLEQGVFVQITNIFVQVANCICPNCKIHLSKIENVFVQNANIFVKIENIFVKMYLSKIRNIFVKSPARARESE